MTSVDDRGGRTVAVEVADFIERDASHALFHDVPASRSSTINGNQTAQLCV